MNKIRTKKRATGCYQTVDGAYEIRSMAYHSWGLSTERAWILFDLREVEQHRDGYCNHFGTKRAALASLERAMLDGEY